MSMGADICALIGLQARPFPLSSSKGLGLLQSHFAGDHVRPQPAAGQVFPIEILRRPAVRETDLEAAALRHGLMLDDADVCHGPMIPRAAAMRKLSIRYLQLFREGIILIRKSWSDTSLAYPPTAANVGFFCACVSSRLVDSGEFRGVGVVVP